jgi:hypothetical protein
MAVDKGNKSGMSQYRQIHSSPRDVTGNADKSTGSSETKAWIMLSNMMRIYSFL